MGRTTRLRAGLAGASAALLLLAACGDADAPTRTDAPAAAAAETARAAPPSSAVRPPPAERERTGRCRITGEVFGDDGPADATITLSVLVAADGTPAATPGREPSWVASHVAGPPTPRTVRTLTTSAGAFLAEGLAPGEYRVGASAQDGRTATADAKFVGDGRTEPVVLVLHKPAPATVLRCRVVSPDGAPFRGLVSAGRAGRWTNDPDVPWLPTSEDGAAALPGPDGTQATVIALLPGRCRVESPPIALPHDGVYVFDLSKAARSVRVHVFDETNGAALPGARVTAGSSDPDIFCVAHTDAEGRCSVLLEQKRGAISVDADGYPPGELPVAQGRASVEVPLRAGVSLRARVVRADDGLPVAGAPVYVRTYDERGIWGKTLPVLTDAEGVAVTRGLVPGGVFVFVRGAGWFSEGLELGRVVGEEYMTNNLRPQRPADWLPEQGTLAVELRVFPAADVAGVVQRHDGTPVAHARLHFYPETTLPHLGDFETRDRVDAESAADGRFVLPGLFPPARYNVSASAESEPGEARALVEARSPGELVLKFQPPCAIDVEIVDAASGAPLSRASAFCAPQEDTNGEWMPARPAGSGATGADGRARIGPVVAGAYDVTASCERYLASSAQRVEVAPGDDAPRLVFRLTLGETIRGTALLPDGAAARGGTASTGDDDDPRNFLDLPNVGEDGAFELTGLTPGTHEVRVTAMRGDEKFEGRARAATGGAAVQIRLAPDAPDEQRPPDAPVDSFVARVVGPDGRPVGAASVYATWSPGPNSTTSTTFSVRAGEVVIPRAARGGTLRVSGASSLNGMPLDLGMLEATLPVDAEDGWEIRLPAGVSLSGKVVDDAGLPIARIRVDVRPKPEEPEDDRLRRRMFNIGGSEPVASSMTGDDGAFELRGLGAVEYELDAAVPEDYESPGDIPVRGGQTDVRVVAKRGMRPVVLVLGPADVPVEGARVTVRAVSGEFGFDAPQSTATTGADGRARLPVLPRAERYHLGVSAAQRDLAGHSETWTPAAEATVRLARLVEISGVVVDPTGAPVPGVDLWYREVDVENHWGFVLTQTDVAGAFRLSGLHDGDVELVAGNYARWYVSNKAPPTLDGADLAASVATRAKAGTRDVQVVLAAAHVVTVKLVGFAGGAPKDEVPELVIGNRRTVLRPVPTKDPAVWLFSGVRPGETYTLWARFPSRGLLGHADGVRAGTERDVTLVQGTDLTGRINPPDGASAGKVTIRFEVAGLEVRETVETDGTFVLPCLPRLEGELRAWSYGGGQQFHAEGRATPGVPFEGKLEPQR